MTLPEKQDYALCYLDFLQRKYPIYKHVTIEVEFTEHAHTWLGRCKVNGTMCHTENTALLVIPCGRFTNKILLTLGHEYKHCLQVFNEGIHIGKIKKPQEDEAHAFSVKALKSFIRWQAKQEEVMYLGKLSTV